MLSVNHAVSFMLNVTYKPLMLSVILLNVVMLNVMAHSGGEKIIGGFVTNNKVFTILRENYKKTCLLDNF
jgi:hypothetical protein